MSMMYQLYEANRALLSPLAEFSSASSKLYSHPLSPFTHTPLAPRVSAGLNLMHRLSPVPRGYRSRTLQEQSWLRCLPITPVLAMMLFAISVRLISALLIVRLFRVASKASRSMSSRLPRIVRTRHECLGEGLSASVKRSLLKLMPLLILCLRVSAVLKLQHPNDCQIRLKHSRRTRCHSSTVRE